MPSFEIPDGPATVPLKPGTAGGQPTRAGQATYSVTNKSQAVVAGRLSVQVAGDAKAEWFQIDGEKERQFQPGETQTVNVNVNVPANVKPGPYKFRPRVVAVNDPDNDHTEGPVATMMVAGAGPTPTTPGKKFPIWIIFVIIGVVVLAAGGITAAVVWGGGGGKVEIADYTGKPAAEAEAALQALNMELVVKRTEVERTDAAAGSVVEQTPKAGEKLDKGAEVNLSVAIGPSVQVPAVVERSYDNAAGLLEGAGLRAVKVAGTASGKAPNWVLAQEPAAGARAGGGSDVKLTVDPGVSVPNFSNMTLESAVRNASGKVNISNVSTRCEAGTVDVIVGQNPAPGTTVALNSGVTVTLRKPVTYPCFRLLPYVRYRELLAVRPGG